MYIHTHTLIRDILCHESLTPTIHWLEASESNFYQTKLL